MEMSIVKKNRRRAKAVERAIAKKLGGRRVGILSQEDVVTDLFSIEVKSRKSVAIWSWYEQAVRNAKGKIPVLVIHITNKHHGNDLVVINLKDFEKLIKKEENK